MTIHKEGRILLLVSLLFLFILNGILFNFFAAPWTWIVLVISVVFYLLILQFFRNPYRLLTKADLQVIAPADGKVVVIEEVIETEYFNTPRRQVSIFMSPINVHINRTPIEGMVQYFKYHAGKYLVAWHPKASTENERTTLVIKSNSGTEILLRQIAGALAKRIRWYIAEGQLVSQGQEFGFIKFGSRVDLFLPLDAKILVNLGDKTKGGVTVIAELTK
ncbi:phosphatidylserine decarboxylase family protein [Cytophagaceae bacterium DM2B3-1]|uniref:Phosphatidylserine decarboxylase proenzyme n=1 Tax=Xanthocytophaga flava TaxID=3048013 RepID=A0AAE3QLH5_9BACT|nr:phosphatidylserine decarboxylase family protein [Xanthocytophaga flavus]MDJ1469079.1 phosphatidylserine decarboxylase family protein [Xanthocytophaga flavus]MDJ1481125.1 phosphatidylserine decarboxylase family protein [Xanthocytophaga flavus]MDJ1497375.1 phosphatidylserine decarboxylase family protein [Xanthocytophaga flavus]